MNEEYVKALEQLGKDVIDCVYDDEGNIIQDNLQYVDKFNEALGKFRQEHPIEVARIEAEVRRYEAEKQLDKARIEADSRIAVAKIEAEARRYEAEKQLDKARIEADSRVASSQIEAEAEKKAASKRMIGEIVGGVVGLIGIFVNFVNLNTVVYAEEKANRIASSKLLKFISTKQP